MFQVIASRIHPEHLESSMSVNQVMVSWMLLIVQGSRRLYECLAFSKPSSSKMWFVHWLLGIAFYLAAAVAIWVEGTGVLCAIMDGYVYTNCHTDRNHSFPRFNP